ncbi:hypothetical protein MMC10_002214 [Thelotrema lepadinum]|nr:hypothetical protein [Thelotrema lepadinum]
MEDPTQPEHSDQETVVNDLTSSSSDHTMPSGYLDDVLTVFQHHNHPVILVGVFAMQWSASRGMPEQTIDFLVLPAEMWSIAADLVISGEWDICANPAYYTRPYSNVDFNTTVIADVWLENTKHGALGPHELKYLHLWPEDLYNLSVSGCRKLEVPDIYPKISLTLEDEYYRDPFKRFGPIRLSACISSSDPYLLPSRCRSEKIDVAIYVPSIQEHLNALLDQEQKEEETNTTCGNVPQ